jgi:hypothetical protein
MKSIYANTVFQIINNNSKKCTVIIEAYVRVIAQEEIEQEITTEQARTVLAKYLCEPERVQHEIEAFSSKTILLPSDWMNLRQLKAMFLK